MEAPKSTFAVLRLCTKQSLCDCNCEAVPACTENMYQSKEASVKEILSPLCFVRALDWIFGRHNLRKAGIILPNYLRLDKIEYADDVGLLDETAAKASEGLSAMSSGAEKEAQLIIATQKRFGQPQNSGFTTEADIEAMDFNFLRPGCDRRFPHVL